MVVGAGGMLGYVTLQYLREQGHSVIGLTKTKEIDDLIRLDVTDEVAIKGFLSTDSFDAVVNCAAMLVEASERRKSEAVKLNTWFPHYLSEYCQRNGSYLIQVSTDGVFSGTEGSYDEHSPCDAMSFYGKSKFLGEIYVDALTVRSGFWGADVNPNGNGLFHWFMQQKSAVSGYSSALFNGVSNLEFARFVTKAIQRRWTGIYHMCAADSISKYDFLCLQNTIFSRNITIHKNESVIIDRTLKNTRNDISYKEVPFAQMMKDLQTWIQRRGRFAHYFGREE